MKEYRKHGVCTEYHVVRTYRVNSTQSRTVFTWLWSGELWWAAKYVSLFLEILSEIIINQ
jgi:hypothetical protein